LVSSHPVRVSRRAVMLLLEHRTGPLEAIATSIWRRNLMTGSMVLLLLTGAWF